MNKKIKVYVDMDGVMCKYHERYLEMKNKNPKIKFPQSKSGFFKNLDPIANAIEIYYFLDKHFDLYILTAPSYKNPLCYTEKRLWIEKYLGIKAAEKMIITRYKNLLKGDYLIDDNKSGCGQDLFEGQLIHFDKIFNNWSHIKDYFIKSYVLIKEEI